MSLCPVPSCTRLAQRLMLLITVSCLAACASVRDAEPVVPAASLSAEALAPVMHRVAPGDELNFRFFYTPTLNTVVTIRSDGNVALPLAGELQVSGLTLAEVAALVERTLSPQVRRPQVTVNVQGTGSQRVFIGGEVGRPGVQPLLGRLSLLQALTVAEGLKDTAQPRNALLMRRGPDGERLVLPIDLAAAMSGTDPTQDLALRPEDVVIVPRSGISNFNLWVDQYIRRMLPFSVGFSYTINRNGSVQ